MKAKLLSLALMFFLFSALLMPGRVMAGEVRGRFRVTLTGFVVNHETVESVLSIDGAGDEVFVVANFADIWLPRNIFGALQRRQSLTFGDTAGRSRPVDARRILPELSHPTTVQAGSMSPTGGLRAPDQFPPADGQLPFVAAARRERAIPMILWDGELRKGGQRANGVILIPTIWENDNVPTVLTAWHRQVDAFIRSFATTRAPRFIDGSTPHRLVDQSDTVLSVVPQTNEFDRPIGLDGDSFNPASATPNPATFIPAVMFLTFDSAEAAANSTGQGRGVVHITYRDGRSYGQGSYTIILRVERIS